MFMDEKEWVKRMVEQSQKKFDEPKPNKIDADPKEIEQITESIRQKIQQKK